MARPILLSNGTLHVGINLYGMVHDLYYPYVGLENHAAAQHMRHRIGVMVEGQFSWLDDGSWKFNMDYEPRALIGHFSAHSRKLNVTLEFTDCVDSDLNAFMRNIHIINSTNKPREIKLFLHQMLLISHSLNSDTGQYLPHEDAILHYKGHRAFAFGAKDQAGKPFQQFSIGVFGIENKEGSYRDAEDGVLSGNAVDFGQVDSIFGFTLKLGGLDSTRVQYWLAAGKSITEAVSLHRVMKDGDIQTRFARTAKYWHRWLTPAEHTIATLPKELRPPFRKSLLILKTAIDRHGAVIASTDTTMLNYWRDAYAYCWPRDAAYALWPLVKLGYKLELRNFFEFCRDALQPDGYLMHKYQPDGAIGTSWHPYVVGNRRVPPIQEDETAGVVFLLGEYIARSKDTKLLDELYDGLVLPATNFMAEFIDENTRLPRATYDLWEEKFLTTTYTTALVYAALRSAAGMAEKLKRTKDVVHWNTVADEIRAASHKTFFNTEKKYFYKGFIHKANEGLQYDNTIDLSSLYAAYTFGLFDKDSPEISASRQTVLDLYKIKDDNPTIVGRYEHDVYATVDPAGLGNPWFITSMWMAQIDAAEGNLPRAQRTMEWVTKTMLKTGVMSEQVNPFNHAFISVAPLTWSQAEFLNTVLELTRVRGQP